MRDEKMALVRRRINGYRNRCALANQATDGAVIIDVCRDMFTDEEAAEMGGWAAVASLALSGDDKVTMYSVRHVLSHYALLHEGGHGRSHSMRGLTGAEFWKEMAAKRAAMMTPEAIERIQGAKNWIRSNLRHGQHTNRRRTSYGIKHVMEADNGLYVTNGEFIVAMLLSGFNMDSVNYNPSFNVVERELLAITRRIESRGRVAA